MLADSFPGTDPGGLWAHDKGGGTTDVETGGEAVVTPANNQAAGSYGAFRTNRYYDLRGSMVSVKVDQTTNPATTATTTMTVGLLNGDQIEIFEKSGHIGFSQQIGTTTTNHKSIPYDPTVHVYWRFREDGTNTYWETSADGSTWGTQAEVATTTLFSLQYVILEIGATTDGGEVNPGAAHFADVNGGGTPTGKWCPVSTITDDFTSTTQSNQWYRSYIDSPETMVQTNGQLVFTLVPNAVDYGAYGSSASYDLTGSAVLVQVPTVASTTGKGQTYISLNGPGGTQLIMAEDGGRLYARSGTVSAGVQDVGSLPYDPVKHAWWRISESGGTLSWDTAPDGKTWTSQVQLSPLPFAIDTLDLELQAGTPSTSASPGQSVYDNLNLPPP